MVHTTTHEDFVLDPGALTHRNSKSLEEHLLEQERHAAHRAIKSRIQHCKGPEPTKRKGIGALRLERRLRSIELADKYDDRDNPLEEEDVDLMVTYVPAQPDEQDSNTAVYTTPQHGCWMINEIATAHIGDEIINLDGGGVLVTCTDEELDELKEYLGSGFSVVTSF